MYYVGVDVGGTGIKVGVVDKEGRIIADNKMPTNAKDGYENVVKDIYLTMLVAIEKSGVSLNDIYGIGVGIPGTIDSKIGVVTYSCNLDWEEVHFIDELKKYIDKPIYISNDANLAAYGEAMFGAGRNYRDSVLLTLGTGVGGGIIIDNNLFEGNKGAGAEVGHIVIDCNGELCNCGRRGCFEAYCSATALIRDTRREMEQNHLSKMWNIAGSLEGVNGKTAFDAKLLCDESAIYVIRRYIRFLAEGIVNIANLLRPEVIMLGGGISNQGDSLIEPLQEYLNCYKYGGKHTPKVKVIKASLGNKAGIIGAAALVMKKQGVLD